MQQLVARGVDAGPVVDDDGAVVGMLSTGDLIVEEARVHFPTVVNFLGVNVTWPFEHKELDDTMAKALGASVGEVMTADARHHRRRGLGRGRGHADARPRPVPPAGARRDGRLVGLIARGDIVKAIVPGHRREPVGRRARRPGRGRPGRPSPTTCAVLRDLVAPAELCAVVKADGYGHGAIAVGQAALAAGADVAGRGAGRGGRGAAQGRHRGPDPAAVPAPPRRHRRRGALRPAAQRSTPPAASRPWPTRPGPPGIGGPRPPQGQHRHEPRRAPQPDDIADAGQGDRPPPRARPRRRCGPTARWPTSPGNPFTDEQLDRFDAGRRPSWTRPGSPRRMRHAANTAAAIDHPRSRYDLVRAGIGIYGISPAPGPRRPGRPAPGPDACGPRCRWSSGWRPASGSPTACATASTATRWWPPSPSATPTACPAGLSLVGGEVLVGGRRRPIVGRGDHGPADGRLRRRRRSRSATRWC